MRMKDQKGITLMILVVTIIVMGLIAGTISYNSIATYQLNAYYMMCSDIELLDEKIALYYLENQELPIQSESIQITALIPDYAEGNANYNPNNSGTLYKIDLTELNNLSLRQTNYYIDEQSHTIYSASGKVIEEEKYYTIPMNYQQVDLSLYQ